MSFGGFSFGAHPSSQPAASTSLFGASQPAPSLFAAPATPASSSLFSTSSSAPSSGGLFGAAPAATASKPLFSFGTPAASAAPATGGLFGASQPAAGGGLFGQTQPAAGGSLFAGLGAQPGGSLLGSQPAPQLQQPQGPAMSKLSKFNDLPDAVRTEIESIDAFIRSQIQVSEEIKTRDLGGEISKTSELYEQYSAEATAVSNMLAQDGRLVAELRTKLETDLSDLAKATAIIEGFKSPQVKGAAAKAVANFPYEFFSRKADEFRERLGRYRSTMDQIQHQVDSSYGLARNPSAIVPTLKAQHSSFMALASSVASLDAQLRQLKDDYRYIWREKTGSVQDPFRNKGGLESATEGLAIR